MDLQQWKFGSFFINSIEWMSVCKGRYARYNALCNWTTKLKPFLLSYQEIAKYNEGQWSKFHSRRWRETDIENWYATSRKSRYKLAGVRTSINSIW